MLKKIIALTILITLLGCGGGGASDSSSTTSKPAVNYPPVANADVRDVGMNVSTVLDVLVNDTDQDAYSVTEVTAPTNGTVINNGSTVVYTPFNGYVGEDSFSYTITDTAGQSATTTVSLVIANIPPTTNNDSVELLQSDSVVIDVLANDVSVGGHQLTINSVSVPSHGILNNDGTQITYTPTAGYAGDDSFIYVVEDSLGDENTATVAVTIKNVLPTTNDETETILQNEAITVDVLANDSDALGDKLRLSTIEGVAHGEATIEANKIVYNPTPGFAGGETIRYTVTDNYGATSQAVLTIAITNVEPIAHDDIVFVHSNESIVIDVLVNDDDVVDDVLTIQSVSAPQHGSVNIVDGKLSYQANSDYIGDDVFEYTLIDSYGASDSGFITVKVRNAIQISGKVVGYQQANQPIVVKVGSQETTYFTDDLGNYTAEISIAKPDELVVLSVNNAAPNYHLRAYLGDVASLFMQAEQHQNIVQEANVSDLTTAEYELIDLVRAGVEATTLAELSAAQYDADNFYQLQMTIAARLINDDNGLTLPEGYSTVNDFIKSTTAMSQQLAKWRDNNNTIYHQAYTSLINDNDLSSYPDRLTDGEHLLSQSTASYGSNYSAGAFNSLSLSGNNSSYLSSHDFLSTSSIQKLTNQLSISYDTPAVDDLYQKTHCDKGDNYEGSYLLGDISGFTLTKIYSTPQYDVYLQKLAVENLYYCQLSDTVAYNTIRHYHFQPLAIESGNFLVNRLQPDDVDDPKYYVYKPTNLLLNGDRSFVDTDDDGNALTGNWSNENNALNLYYSDGSSMHYQKITDYFGLPQLAMNYRKNGQRLSTGSSLLTKPNSFNWPYTTGYLSFDIDPIFDNAINNKNRWVFSTDNTVNTQYLSDGEWVDYVNEEYSWTLEGNRYQLKSYNLDNEYVSYCDITVDGCYLYATREFEIIGVADGVYQVKYTNQRFSSDGQMTSNSNYIRLIRYTPL